VRRRLTTLALGGVIAITSLANVACSNETKDDLRKTGSDITSDVKSDASKASSSASSFSSSLDSDSSSSSGN
jgi:hypothetical protein